MPVGTALFLDTSIQIARFVHGPETKQRIEDRLSQYEYSLIVTSEVVLQEFKRRLLTEALYLLNQFKKHGSYKKVFRHIADVLSSSPYHNRKRNICLDLLATIGEKHEDADLTDRAISYLRTFIKCGVDDFESSVGSIIREANCLCARQPIKQVGSSGNFDFGKTCCSKFGTTCGVGRFLLIKQETAAKILSHLKDVPEPEKTEELVRAEDFLERYIEDLSRSHEGDPCLKVGDLIIAIESSGIPEFYTINVKESIILCRILGQKLIVRPTKHEQDDVVHEWKI